MRLSRLLIPAVVVCALAAFCFQPKNEPSNLTRWHLTARPWKPLAIPREKYLEAIEGLSRFSIHYQNAEGAIIDPFLHREHQYATPYFAVAVGTLVAAGHAKDLLPQGIRAMEHATKAFAGGRDAIPQQHGEFFIPALTEGLEIYEPLVPKQQYELWRERMKTPLSKVIAGSNINNWQTYAMRGQWMRATAGLADRREVESYIEHAWQTQQKARIAAAPWFLYHDRTSKPDTLSVEAVGRGNLLGLIESGYRGSVSDEIRRAAEEGTTTTLLLQDPSGQTPVNGRTDGHVWVDVGYMLAFEVMAERSLRAGDSWLAGQYRHASELAFRNIQRWRRSDGSWAGSYFVTKNHFDPALRVGYQTASEYSNYNGSLMLHLAEAWHLRKAEIEEKPAPAEIGGYAFELDPEYAVAFANAGGLQMQFNLRGQTEATHGNLWTPLGVARIARAGWDTRLGPADGVLTSSGGVSFAPAFEEKGKWLRLADLSARYKGRWSSGFVHPLLVKCSVEYRPVAGQSGPVFRQDFVLTPDVVLSTVTRESGTEAWGVTWPLIENDGRPLVRRLAGAIGSTRYPDGQDEQNFIALDAGAVVTIEDRPLRGTYGDIRPVRFVNAGSAANRTLVYPRSAGDPAAEAVRQSFRAGKDGFETSLGRVTGTLYIGRTSAGGWGQAIDLDRDGRPDVSFSTECAFVLTLRNGRVTAVEADRAVKADVQGNRLNLDAFRPAIL